MQMTEHVHNLKYFRKARQELRKNITPQELLLWKYFRRKSFNYKFKRQHSIGNFIVDFYCPARKLIIELDGSQHLDNQEADTERTWYFESLGLRVIRFWNNEVDKNINGVMMKIEEELKQPLPPSECRPPLN